MSQIIQGDDGTVFDFTVKNKGKIVDIRGATVEVFVKNRNYEFTKRANIVDGQNGKCEIVLNRDNTQYVGTYLFQATVTLPDGREFSSGTMKFNVGKKLK